MMTHVHKTPPLCQELMVRRERREWGRSDACLYGERRTPFHLQLALLMHARTSLYQPPPSHLRL